MRSSRFRVALGLLATIFVGAVAAPAASATSTGIVAWGDNFFGELGTGNEVRHSAPVSLRRPVNVSAVTAGWFFSVALLENGEAEAWGLNTEDQLGNGGAGAYVNEAVKVKGLTNATAISSGSNFTLALRSNGTIKSWGANKSGQLGLGGTEPRSEAVEIPEFGEVSAISANGGYGLSLSLAVRKGKAWAWGSNNHGQLGIGTTTGPEECGTQACSTKPVEVKGLENVVAVAAGPDHALALLENGKVVAWGYNASGQIGDGTHETRPEPVSVPGLSEIVAISAGYEYSLALNKKGEVWAWGSNYYGELGIGTTEEERTEPTKITGLSNVTAISAGTEHALALLENGKVEAWGANEEGDLGVHKTKGPETCHEFPCSRKPLQVSEISGEAKGIAAGGEHSLAYGPAGPIVAKVTPSSGSPEGGTTVKITGNHFMNVTEVKFGSANAKSFARISETEIIAETPAGSGSVRVSVKDEQGVINPSPTSTGPKFDFIIETAPEFGRCKKVEGTGKYSNAGCTTAVSEGGSYEWTKGVAATHFTLAAGEAKLETIGKATVTCTGGSGSGEYTSAKTIANTVIKLTGCQHAGVKCKSPSAAEGELVSSPLEGELGWRNIKTGTVGLALTPAEEAAFAAGTCGETSLLIQGSVIAANLETNKMAKTAPWPFAQTGGKQKPERLEGEPEVLEMTLSPAKAEQTGLALTITQTNEEEVEVNAVV